MPADAEVDVVLRGGTVVDGTGAAPYVADVAVRGGKIAAVGPRLPVRGREEMDCTGMHVTPGWVDIHTHYDAQVTWDPLVSPSGQHGVTTVVFGNCGVGFAPCRPADRKALAHIMESVEDIPGGALHEGVKWDWTTFPEYLDSLERVQAVADFAAIVAHTPLRVYAMGAERAVDHRTPMTDADVAEIKRLVREAVEAGAIGFSTNRTVLHRHLVDGHSTPIPGTFSGTPEMYACAEAMAEGGGGVFEVASDFADGDKEMHWIARLSKGYGLPASYGLGVPPSRAAANYFLNWMAKAKADGADVTAQVMNRAQGLLHSFTGGFNLFLSFAAYRDLKGLPMRQRLDALARPDVRARILAEAGEADRRMEATRKETGGTAGQQLMRATMRFRNLFPLVGGAAPNYEPNPATESIDAIARSTGRSTWEVMYDTLAADGGRGVVWSPVFGYQKGDLELARALIEHPLCHLGLADGGAHVGQLCEAGAPTFNLQHWVRDRTRGPRLPIEMVVRKQTADNARLYRLADRGAVRPGLRADLNVIDLSKVRALGPEWVNDLPAGAGRWTQRSEGYRLTLCAGVTTFRDGAPTGARPGRLVRNPNRGRRYAFRGVPAEEQARDRYARRAEGANATTRVLPRL